MQTLFAWFIGYICTPALTMALVLLYGARSALRRALFVHAGLLTSILFLQLFIAAQQRTFPQPGSIGVLVFAFAIVGSYLMLRSFGIVYLISSIMQELVLVSAIWILITLYPIHIIWLLIVPIFVISHYFSKEHIWSQTLANVIWGTLSVILFIQYRDWMINAALHALLGGFMIQQGIFKGAAVGKPIIDMYKKGR